MQIKVALDKDSKAFIQKLGKFDIAFRTALIRKADEVGLWIADQVRVEIDSQQFKALNERYRNWKIRHGYNEMILKMTDVMYHQISYKRMSASAALIRGDIGFRIGTMHKHWRATITKTTRFKRKDGKEITRKSTKPVMFPTAVLAQMLEEGTRRIPERPFMKQTFNRVKGDVVGKFQGVVASVWMA